MMLGFGVSPKGPSKGDKRVRTAEKTRKHEKMWCLQGELRNLVQLLPEETREAVLENEAGVIGRATPWYNISVFVVGYQESNILDILLQVY